MKGLYSGKLIESVDKAAAEYLEVSSFELMQRASAAIYAYLHKFHDVLVVTGAGNNAGDGFIIADLTRADGKTALVWSLVKIENLPNDAQIAAQQYLDNGGTITTKKPKGDFDCIVDSILGTGLSRGIDGVFADTINWINSQKIYTLAVDIPSGLDTDTGSIRGCCVNADSTISVICNKIGQFINNGKDQCGNLFLEEITDSPRYLDQIPTTVKLLDKSVLNSVVFNRKQNSHKGSFGSTVIVGGHDGMLGALMLAGNAALRSGCGLVEVVSNIEQAVMISIQSPELMTASDVNASRLIKQASVISVGPGLGLNQQSKQVLEFCIAQNKPMVIDADALTLITGRYKFENNVVLTPHPKEAASLLNTDVKTIQSDRINSALKISQQYNATVILKGSGTIIANPKGDVFVCPYGYAGMATAGMGDVLTGIVASLIAQNFNYTTAAYAAVAWHALAAENCGKGNCLIASDVINQLPNELL